MAAAQWDPRDDGFGDGRIVSISTACSISAARGSSGRWKRQWVCGLLKEAFEGDFSGTRWISVGFHMAPGDFHRVSWKRGWHEPMVIRAGGSGWIVQGKGLHHAMASAGSFASGTAVSEGGPEGSRGLLLALRRRTCGEDVFTSFRS
jgi:hypothetical protein